MLDVAMQKSCRCVVKKIYAYLSFKCLLFLRLGYMPDSDVVLTTAATTTREMKTVEEAEWWGWGCESSFGKAVLFEC